jgi:hypothetical protein
MPIDSILATSAAAVRIKQTDNNRGRRVYIDKTSEVLTIVNSAGSLVKQVDDTHTQTIGGAKTFSGAVTFSGTIVQPTQDGLVQYAEVSMTSAEVKALRATPKTLVAAPGAGKLLRFLGIDLLLDYGGNNGFTESGNNLAVKYTDGSGAAVSSTIEMTGFIDQTADTRTQSTPLIDAIVAKSGSENKALVLHNTSGAEIGGNAGADNVVRAKVWYSIISTGW